MNFSESPNFWVQLKTKFWISDDQVSLPNQVPNQDWSSTVPGGLKKNAFKRSHDQKNKWDNDLFQI